MSEAALPEKESSENDFRLSREQSAELEAVQETETEQDGAKTLAERHPDWPPIKLDFLFSSHGTNEDYRGLPEQLEHADILFIEDSAGDREQIDLLRGFSGIPEEAVPGVKKQLNDHMEEQGLAGTRLEALIHMIAGSGKVVESYDLTPEEFELREQLLKLYELPVRQYPTFDETLSHWGERFVHVANLQREREKIMVERLGTRLEEIMEAHPELKEREEIRTLTTMGSIHTTLYHDFRERGEDVSRDFSDNPYVFGFQNQLTREYMWGRQPSREMLVGAYVEKLVYLAARDVVPSTRLSDDRVIYLRDIASRFSAEDAERIHGELDEGDLYSDDDKLSEIMPKEFEEKGVALATTVEEVEAEAAKIRERR